MKIVVIGGSGRVGGDVVRRLAPDGHDAVTASPAARANTITGGGLADVMAGADVVVAVSNAPVWDDDALGAPRRATCWRPSATPASSATRRRRSSASSVCPIAAIYAQRRPRRRWPGWRPARQSAGASRSAPEALGVDAWGRRLFAATGDERTVIDFETSLATHPQGARR
jgi:hypothetical protein